MILTCSSCSTRFLADAAAIGANGRRVRCARCQHVWFQEPAADFPRPLPQPGLLFEHEGPSAAASGRPAPLQKGANLPAIQRPGWRAADLRGLAALAVLTIALLGAGYGFRERIVHAWPPAATYYATLGIETAISSLRLADVSFAQSIQSGVPVLTVKGVVINDAMADNDAPLLLIQLRDNRGSEIEHWTHKLPQDVVAAGGRVEFETRLENPPATAQKLDVSFAPAGFPASPPEIAPGTP